MDRIRHEVWTFFSPSIDPAHAVAAVKPFGATSYMGEHVNKAGAYCLVVGRDHHETHEGVDVAGLTAAVQAIGGVVCGD